VRRDENDLPVLDPQLRPNQRRAGSSAAGAAPQKPLSGWLRPRGGASGGNVREVILGAPQPEFRYRFPVRFQDVDAAGIVFFARFFDYFHDGYVAFMGHRGVDFARPMAEGRWAAPLKHVEADYLAPARFGDVVEAEVVGKRVDGSLVSLFHRLRRDDKVLATARTDHVYVDFHSFKRIPLPAEAEQALSILPDF